MGFAEIFSDKYYPNLKSYTLLVAGLIAGGATVSSLFGDGDFSFFGKSNKENTASIEASTTFCWAYNTTAFWEKSPVLVEKGNTVSISTSGIYYLNIDQLRNTEGKNLGINANGIASTELDSLSASLIIAPEARYGQLIAQIVGANNQVKTKPKRGLIPLNHGDTSFVAESDGYLWFASNQPSFSPYQRVETKIFNQLRGDSIDYLELKRQQHEPYYEDNFGQLIITAKVHLK